MFVSSIENQYRIYTALVLKKKIELDDRVRLLSNTIYQKNILKKLSVSDVAHDLPLVPGLDIDGIGVLSSPVGKLEFSDTGDIFDTFL